MKKQIFTLYSFLLGFVLLLFMNSCTSTTMIESIPSGAKVYMDGESVGTTPYLYEDTKISFSTTSVRLEMEGYEIYHTSITRDEDVDVGAIIGGFFVYVPWLWTMKYKAVHTYELDPSIDNLAEDLPDNMPQKALRTKAQMLRELKALLDDDIITQEEFEIEKKKILEREDLR